MWGDPPKGLAEAEALSLIGPGRDDEEQRELDEENPEGMAGVHKDFFDQQRENPDK